MSPASIPEFAFWPANGATRIDPLPAFGISGSAPLPCAALPPDQWGSSFGVALGTPDRIRPCAVLQNGVDVRVPSPADTDLLDAASSGTVRPDRGCRGPDQKTARSVSVVGRARRTTILIVR